MNLNFKKKFLDFLASNPGAKLGTYVMFFFTNVIFFCIFWVSTQKNMWNVICKGSKFDVATVKKT